MSWDIRDANNKPLQYQVTKTLLINYTFAKDNGTETISARYGDAVSIDPECTGPAYLILIIQKGHHQEKARIRFQI